MSTAAVKTEMQRALNAANFAIQDGIRAVNDSTTCIGKDKDAAACNSVLGRYFQMQRQLLPLQARIRDFDGSKGEASKREALNINNTLRLLHSEAGYALFDSFGGRSNYAGLRAIQSLEAFGEAVKRVAHAITAAAFTVVRKTVEGVVDGAIDGSFGWGTLVIIAAAVWYLRKGAAV